MANLTVVLLPQACHRARRGGDDTTGNFFIDDEVLAKAGVTDLGRYSVVPGSKQLMPDLFL
jgi:citronellol/citronellal dehydrogenase